MVRGQYDPTPDPGLCPKFERITTPKSFKETAVSFEAIDSRGTVAANRNRPPFVAVNPDFLTKLATH